MYFLALLAFIGNAKGKNPNEKDWCEKFDTHTHTCSFRPNILVGHKVELFSVKILNIHKIHTC